MENRVLGRFVQLAAMSSAAFSRGLFTGQSGLQQTPLFSKARKTRSEPGQGPVRINQFSGLRKRMRAFRRGEA